MADLEDSDSLAAEKTRPFVVSVEGNIGSGKSTMLSYFEKAPDVHLDPEPVGQWYAYNLERYIRSNDVSPYVCVGAI